MSQPTQKHKGIRHRPSPMGADQNETATSGGKPTAEERSTGSARQYLYRMPEVTPAGASAVRPRVGRCEPLGPADQAPPTDSAKLEPPEGTTTSYTAADLETLDLEAQGTAETGTQDTSVQAPPADGSIRSSLQDLCDRALTETGVEREDLIRILRLLEQARWAIPPALGPGTEIWLRLLRYLLEEGDQERAIRLFKAGGEKSISWVESLLDRYWPVGFGIAVDVSVSATFGLPLQLTGKERFSMVRTGRGTVELVRQGSLLGGFDTGIGTGAFLKLGTHGIGATAGSQAQLGLQLLAHEEFIFEILQDAGFVPLLVHVAKADSLARIAGYFESSLRSLNPDLYRARVKLEAKLVGSGVAAAEAGLRSPGAASGAGGERLTHSTFGRAEGKREDSRREFIFFDDQANKTVNWRAVVQSIFRLFVRGDILLDAGGGTDIKLKYAPGPCGARSLESLKLQIYAEGAAAGGIVAQIPVVSAALPTGLRIDAGGGLRVTWQAVRPFNEEAINFEGHEVYVKSGDLDLFTGPAHEIAMQLPGLDPAAYASLDAFLGAVQTSTMEHRFAVGSPLGRNYAIALGKGERLTVLLSPKYREWGFHVVGYVTAKFRLPGDVLSRILGKLGILLTETLEADAKVKQLVRGVTESLSRGDVPQDLAKDVQEAAVSTLQLAVEALKRFLETGELPQPLNLLQHEVLKQLLLGLQRIEFRGEFCLGIAGGAEIAKGAKARLTGSASGCAVYQENITEDLRASFKKGVMATNDLLALLQGTWDQIAPQLDITPDDLKKPLSDL